MNAFDNVLQKFPTEVQQRYDFTNAVYTGALNRIEGVTCKEHGVFSQYAAQFRKGRGCPKCGGVDRANKRRMSQEDFIEACKVKHSHRNYDYSQTQYLSMAKKITVLCPDHGPFVITALKHYYEGQGCGLCEQEAKKQRIVQYRHLSAPAKINNTGKSFFDECTKVHAGLYTYPEQEYKGAKEPIDVLCGKHGLFQQAAWKHLNGAGCPNCGQRSSQEASIKEFLEGYGLLVETRNRSILAPKEIDLWLPELKVGIEYHGLHWHTEDRVGNVHRQKWEMAQKSGIRLVQIFEDEWLDKQEIVKSRLAAIVGKSPSIYARKTTTQAISSSKASEFLERHHIQGKSATSVAYGLFLEDRLVAVATFGRARGGAMTASDAQAWEVYRYASDGRVVGGFSKLFAQFVKDFQPSSVISYCDLRYGTGGLYKAAGFDLAGVSEPDYWWVPRGKVVRIPRYKTQKHKLAKISELAHVYSPGKTERQVCEDAGWRRIFGVGNQKWLWSLDTPQKEA